MVRIFRQKVLFTGVVVGKKSDAILGVFASFSNSNVYTCVEIIAHIKEVGNHNNEWVSEI